MIINNIKIATRTLRKNKIYTIINMIGLAIGIAAALLIFRIVKYEYSFNKSFENYDRIVRVIHLDKPTGGEEDYGSCIPIPAMDEMESTVSQFAAMARVKEVWSNITIPNPFGGAPLKKFVHPNETISFFTESSFFEVFRVDWLAGDAATALESPDAIVLTKTWAEKCFDNWENAIGKTITLDNITPVTVRGVINDFPTNCDLPIQYLVSYEVLKANSNLFFYNDNWGACSSNDQVFALLEENANWDATNAVLAKVGAEHYTEDGVQERVHLLQALSDVHYNDEVGTSGGHQTSKSLLKVLSLIGLLVLIMACFNFVNLATAQATLRAKEVGVRKAIGGHRNQLIGQFMTETGLLVFAAVLVGAILAQFASPLLSHVAHVPVELPFLSDPPVLVFLAAMFAGVTLLAGAYPALMLSGFKPVTALQSNVTHARSGGIALRKSLVILQFAIAQALIIGAVVTISQMDYIRSKDLGFKKDLVYTFGFNNDSTTQARQHILKQRLLQIPRVESVSLNSDQPFSGSTWSSNFKFADRPEDEEFNVTMKFCDEDYQKTYGIKMLAGEWYPKSDTMKNAVINKTLLNKLGITAPQEAIGQKIWMGRRRGLIITGVTDDFHAHSFRTEHLPLMMSSRKIYYWDAGVKIRPDQIATTTAAIHAVYDEVLPEQILEGRFLDENIARFYEDEERLSNTAKAFGLLAILISCLGLFGLATHAAAQRIKEIGIRKVLGSSVSAIVGLLSKDFIRLVLVALLVAAPLGYYLMRQWLNNFVYRIDIEWWVFALTGLLTIGIAFITVSYQSIRAAVANPIESLRSE